MALDIGNDELKMPFGDPAILRVVASELEAATIAIR
jgi:hypothetical protein